MCCRLENRRLLVRPPARPIFFLRIDDSQDSFLSYYCPLFRQWLSGKAAIGLERILCRVLVNPNFPNSKFWTLSNNNLKDNNFKFDDIGRKFAKRVENTVEKGEIPRYEQFLLFPQCFPKSCTAET